MITNLEDQKPNLAYLPILLLGATSANEDLRGRSVEMLGSPIYSSPEAVAAIKKATSDWSEGVRWSAGQALVAGGYSSTEAGSVAGSDTGAAKESVANLLKLLRDRSDMVRQEAAESLGRLKLGSPEVVAALREALKDSDNDVRTEAAGALGAIGKPAKDAVPQLWTIWNDSRKIVERTGLKALKDRADIELGGAAGKAVGDISGEPVEEMALGWYQARWNMSPEKLLAAFQKDVGPSMTEESGPPTIVRIPNLDCGCGAGTRCVWECVTSHLASEVTLPVSVSFVFDPADKLSKVLVKSHVGDLSRCDYIGNILAGLEWTYSTNHTKTQSQSPDAKVGSYVWTLYKSSLTYKTEISPSACEMELDYANAGME
ncbi:MAG TPA: HEAT repeat domain-containing protein [Thermoanaerobaculia bacterium]|nr:HEAT repeat domain-containing protein [Thermoanaerobaculia bacterium]